MTEILHGQLKKKKSLESSANSTIQNIFEFNVMNYTFYTFQNSDVITFTNKRWCSFYPNHFLPLLNLSYELCKKRNFWRDLYFKHEMQKIVQNWKKNPLYICHEQLPKTCNDYILIIEMKHCILWRITSKKSPLSLLQS